MTVGLMITSGNGFRMMETFINNEIPGYVIGFMLMIGAGYDDHLVVGVGEWVWDDGSVH
jgi:hypothetical protein